MTSCLARVLEHYNNTDRMLCPIITLIGCCVSLLESHVPIKGEPIPQYHCKTLYYISMRSFETEMCHLSEKMMKTSD